RGRAGRHRAERSHSSRGRHLDARRHGYRHAPRRRFRPRRRPRGPVSHPTEPRAVAGIGDAAAVVGVMRERCDRNARAVGQRAMKSVVLEAAGAKTWALIFDKCDEPVSGLTAFAKAEKLGGAHFTAIGAFSEVTLGYFDRSARDYKKIPLREQVEVLSLIGD